LCIIIILLHWSRDRSGLASNRDVISDDRSQLSYRRRKCGSVEEKQHRMLAGCMAGRVTATVTTSSRRRDCTICRWDQSLQLSSSSRKWSTAADIRRKLRVCVSVCVILLDLSARTTRYCCAGRGLGVSKNWDEPFCVLEDTQRCSWIFSTRYRTAGVDKRIRSTNLYHSRQCGIVLKPRSDATDYTVVCFRMHDSSQK